MGWGDKVNIVATSLLELYHYFSKFFARNLIPLPALTDLIILTKATAHIAVGEEDGARTVPSHQGGLLTEMRTITRNHGERSGPAES
jgi:hypothetical protein